MRFKNLFGVEPTCRHFFVIWLFWWSVLNCSNCTKGCLDTGCQKIVKIVRNLKIVICWSTIHPKLDSPYCTDHFSELSGGSYYAISKNWHEIYWSAKIFVRFFFFIIMRNNIRRYAFCGLFLKKNKICYWRFIWSNIIIVTLLIGNLIGM